MARHTRRKLPPSPRSARAGRRFVDAVLRRWGLDGQRDTATLLTSELVANAVVHAATTVTVDVAADLDRREVVVAVTDHSWRPALPPVSAVGLRSLLREPDLDAESGRGLMIVAILADRWGIDPAPPGKTVWFALSISATQAISARSDLTRRHDGVVAVAPPGSVRRGPVQGPVQGDDEWRPGLGG